MSDKNYQKVDIQEDRFLMDARPILGGLSAFKKQGESEDRLLVSWLSPIEDEKSSEEMLQEILAFDADQPSKWYAGMVKDVSGQEFEHILAALGVDDVGPVASFEGVDGLRKQAEASKESKAEQETLVETVREILMDSEEYEQGVRASAYGSAFEDPSYLERRARRDAKDILQGGGIQALSHNQVDFLIGTVRRNALERRVARREIGDPYAVLCVRDGDYVRVAETPWEELMGASSTGSEWAVWKPRSAFLEQPGKGVSRWMAFARIVERRGSDVPGDQSYVVHMDERFGGNIAPTMSSFDEIEEWVKDQLPESMGEILEQQPELERLAIQRSMVRQAKEDLRSLENVEDGDVFDVHAAIFEKNALGDYEEVSVSGSSITQRCIVGLDEARALAEDLVRSLRFDGDGTTEATEESEAVSAA